MRRGASADAKGRGSPAGRITARFTRAVARRPDLWPTALRQSLRMARPGWWRRPPFLPWPDRGYLAFRLETQYGSEGMPRRADVITYLEWCRDQQRALHRRHAPARR